jgi:hypothetical protein
MNVELTRWTKLDGGKRLLSGRDQVLTTAPELFLLYRWPHRHFLLRKRFSPQKSRKKSHPPSSAEGDADGVYGENVSETGNEGDTLFNATWNAGESRSSPAITAETLPGPNWIEKEDGIYIHGLGR